MKKASSTPAGAPDTLFSMPAQALDPAHRSPILAPLAVLLARTVAGPGRIGPDRQPYAHC
jgi:hypothetical protein